MPVTESSPPGNSGTLKRCLNIAQIPNVLYLIFYVYISI